jgi:hypothetical protein
VNGSCQTVVHPQPCDGACTAATPICDETSNTCKACTATAGCEGAAPVCDTTANGGVGACVACLGTSDCVDPSVCDTTTHTCVGCTATEGCADATPVCVDGTCVACTADGTGCDAGEVCDTSVTGGACVTCTATAGCAEDQICDLSVTGGACITCTADGTGCDFGQVCDTSVTGGACVGCLGDDDCTGLEICDTDHHECVTCNAANEGCQNPWPYCDVAANDGKGECVGCLSNAECSGDYPVCHPERQSCVTCAANSDCGGDTPYCDTSVSAGVGACVACIDNTQCTDPNAPICDPDANGGKRACAACSPREGCSFGTFCDTAAAGGSACVVCNENRGCLGDLVCDTSVAGGECVTCLADGSGCTGGQFCDTTVAGGACASCLPSGEGCAADESCVDGACALTASLQIQAVRDAAEDVPLALPITGAFVTYVRPDTGDPDGFFVQAEPTGPAILVMVSPGSLAPVPAVGDRVSFTATMKDVYGDAEEITTIDGWTVTSSGNDVSSFIQDLTAATDLLTNIDGYEAELATVSGSIAGTFGGSGSGMTAAPFTTTGMTTADPNLLLRMPTTLRDSLDLTETCTFTVVAAPMWRYGTKAQLTTYAASDLEAIQCPAPTWVSAAATSATTVNVTFDRVLDPASVLADGSQFTFDNGLVATAASVSGRTVAITTGSQTGGTVYAVTVAATVLGLHGAPAVAPAGPVTFTGFAAPVGSLVINEIDYDQPGTDTAEFIEVFNGTASAVTLDDLDLILVNGSSTGSIYGTIALGTGTLPAGGYLVAGLAAVTVPPGAIKVNFASGVSLQNGDPDAVVLFNRATGTVVDALSYGGTNPTPTVAIPAGGTPYSFVNDHAPLKDPGTTGLPPQSMIRNPSGVDTNTPNDWALSTTVTPGAANVYTAP